MSQGLVHNQPLLYASPSKDPRAFLGTLPGPSTIKDDKPRVSDPEQVSLFFNSLVVVIFSICGGELEQFECCFQQTVGEGIEDCLAV